MQNNIEYDPLGADADPLEIHAANIVGENVGQSHGSLNGRGNRTRTVSDFTL